MIRKSISTDVAANYWLQPIVSVILLLCITSIQAENVLFIVADDLGVDFFEEMCPELYGSDTTETISPTLNNLCQNAIFFKNAWAYTACSPTRASMLTGRYGFRNGVTQVGGDYTQSVIEENEITLPKVLDAAISGYSHANIGKWHLQNDRTDGDYPVVMGWEYYYGLLNGGVSDYSLWPATQAIRRADDSVEVLQLQQTQEDYITSVFTDQAISWINNRNSAAKPWLLWLAYTAPHSPFHKPPSELLADSPFADLAESGESDADYYRAMVYAMDKELGRVLEAVDLENTFVVFLGDNGSPGEVVAPELVGKVKGSPYEGGLRVPMMIIPPQNKGYSGAKQIDDLVHTVDIFPTLLEMAGLDLTTLKSTGGVLENIDIDGTSLFDYITDPYLITAPNARSFLYDEVSPANTSGSRTVKNNNFKLIRFNSGVEEFYAVNCAISVADCMHTFLPTETMDFLEGGVAEDLPSEQLITIYNRLSDQLDQVEAISDCESGITNPVGTACGGVY